jgi:hypothetical protein
VEDLGLITTKGQLRISNPIYLEIIPRILTYSTQLTITKEPAWYFDPVGRLERFTYKVAVRSFFSRRFFSV